MFFANICYGQNFRNGVGSFMQFCGRAGLLRQTTQTPFLDGAEGFGVQ